MNVIIEVVSMFFILEMSLLMMGIIVGIDYNKSGIGSKLWGDIVLRLNKEADKEQ